MSSSSKRGNKLLVLALLMAGLFGRGSARAEEHNPCGCYRTDMGTCICDRNAKCGCPGDCEPQGCDAKREKAFQKEVDAETKRAREEGKKHSGTEGGDSSDRPAPKQPSAGPPPSVRKLSDGQTKELVKLLDAYFKEHPDARAETAGALREKLAGSR